ncbi:ribonucleotide reductase subunit B [Maribacter phage Colly_1]|uniref:ribonucleoside-diphosphate reductase n=1 Tax=Maribacter phage Colly_1 TaxID=2745691 RepID=A0A8E4UY12_9CAUD|nr:ribonucleotide reductase subunit B [Maribacter phage Colly_1]QQO97328.1 ribonucleotide reductase subunit B [Maribacter phage Colly_1]
MSIFVKTKHIDPKYNFLEKYVSIMYRGMWTPAKYEKHIKEIDAPQFFNEMPEVDRETIRRCILAVSMVEDKVKTYWCTLPIQIPQTIVGDVGGLFGQSEVTHRRSYHSLAEHLKVDCDLIDTFPVLRGRVQYLKKYLEPHPLIKGNKLVLKKLILFTALVERASLFTQFYILMSYALHNRGLKTISALQESTAKEEMTHYKFGLSLINIIKEEHPEMWDELLAELVTKNIKDAYASELNLIDWFFEKGTPSHLTKGEVVNFLNYNFNVICEDLQINLNFEVNDDLFEDKSAWFKRKVFITGEPDFFDNSAGGYAADDEEISVDSIFDN